MVPALRLATPIFYDTVEYLLTLFLPSLSAALAIPNRLLTKHPTWPKYIPSTHLRDTYHQSPINPLLLQQICT